MLKRFICLLAVTLLFLILGFLAFFLKFLLTPVATKPIGTSFDLNPGTTLSRFSENLYQQGIIKYPRLFIQLVRLKGKSHELKAGVYQIKAGTTPIQLVKQVTEGTGQLYHAFTIVPGWTYQQLKLALSQVPTITHHIDKMNEQQIEIELGTQIIFQQGNELLGETKEKRRKSSLTPFAITFAKEHLTNRRVNFSINFPLEGLFYPDTYYYSEGTSDIKLLRRAFMRMQVKLQDAWEKRDRLLPYENSYQTLIAASLIEKETSLDSERPVIAGVLLNRMQKKMLLQFDPTVIYGVIQSQMAHKAVYPGFKGTLRKQDLKLDSPYNTYRYKGLPPTPIAIPSIASIQAVLHPVFHQYFYFVANTNGIGHQFSQSLVEHNIAVKMVHKHDAGFFNYTLVKKYILKTLLKPLMPLMPSVNLSTSEFTVMREQIL